MNNDLKVGDAVWVDYPSGPNWEGPARLIKTPSKFTYYRVKYIDGHIGALLKSELRKLSLEEELKYILLGKLAQRPAS